MNVHIVQKGDTLWKISRQYGISFEDLKRVNAHLANPDYIVPGMKIFLPEHQQNTGGNQHPSTNTGQTKGEAPEKIVKVEKKPEQVTKPTPPKEEAHRPKEPIPLPSAPKPPSITSKPTEQPKPKPPTTPPKGERPQETPAPPKREPRPVPETHHQTPQMVPVQPYPIIGIPCGWFPIYDADCYPHTHPGQMQPMPARPHAGQLPVQEHHHIKPCNPATRPIQQAHPVPKHEPVKPMPLPPKLQEPSLSVPSKIPDIEAPVIPLTPPKKEQKPVPTPPTYEAPRPQTLEALPHQNWSYESQQSYPGQTGQFIPMPMPMQMQPHQMPMQAHPFCNTCHQPIQQQPMFYPMPFHWQGS